MTLHTALGTILTCFLFALARSVTNDTIILTVLGVQNNSIYKYDLLSPSGDPPSLMPKDDQVNLTAITWAHAVNSQKELEEALSGFVDMIEADIVLGQINGSGPDLPVMAHPPAVSSDISLVEFLNRILEYNAAHAAAKKGVKLDFKSIEVFEGSLAILNEMIPIMNYPVWLNADIVSGPVNQNSTLPVDPARFFAGCAPYGKAVLSIGWTTRWGADYRDEAYTSAEIDNMLQVIKNNNVTATGQPITFPVRAGIAANSRELLHDLVRSVNETNESSLTIWSSENDYVNIEKLRQLIFSFGFHRVYLDVPDEVSSKLDLGRSGGMRTLSSIISFSLISAFMVIASCWLQGGKL